ncbi:CoA-binding protein [Clostridium estertheticum]|uniref:CoA-binding protein n=1 Tax=Clostridium estertheticum TaxID=238834 RepID=UPI001CF0ED58|nr:CoA-binding protein [Clostridium estertheticum]MCB2307457.1 CoA-binding protein [Clostridium estertheticum]MCB2345714.1 CoA-binding protein [Clostridium estertheticum]MCB2350946.1 CoA-binding protein [Clostridium estertheticum]WAG44072.1 CoA-binding protein [Clostridium estertheticum]
MKANELLNYKNWVVVGDVLNPSKYAYKILLSLKTDGFNVVGVNPSIENKSVYNNLSDIPYNVEVLDLCINPYKGIKILNEAHTLKINKVLIQPGAGSPEILQFCKTNGIQAIEGCALVELSKKIK